MELLIKEINSALKEYKDYISKKITPINEKELEKNDSKKNLNIESLLSRDLGEYPLIEDNNIFNSLFNVYKKIENYLILNKSEDNLIKELVYHKNYIENRLLVPNIRLVKYIATKIFNRYKNFQEGLHMELIDLINEGWKGLIRAFEKFDPKKNTKGFGSYASFWIQQKISRAIEDKSKIIRIPSYKQKKISELSKQESDLESRLGREVTIKELSERTDLSIQEITEIKESNDYNYITSLDSSASGEGESSLSNFIVDERYGLEDKINMRDLINNLLEVLTEQERDVLEYRFGLNNKNEKTLRELGENYNLTKERVRQIEKNAKEKVKARYEKIKGLEKRGIRLN